MVIQHNLAAMNANRMLVDTYKDRSKITEKLSSGYRINRAADDSSGLAISEKMRRQIRGLEQGAKNIDEGIAYCKVADGAMNEVADILIRMKDDINVKSESTALDAMDKIDKAAAIVSRERARFGAYQNRLEHAKAINDNTQENTQAAESLIRDTNMPKMMVTHSKLNILSQGGESMLAQANQSKQSVLSLLQ